MVSESRWVTLVAPDVFHQLQMTEGMPLKHDEGVVTGLLRSKGPGWILLIRSLDGAVVEQVPLNWDGKLRFYKPHTGRYILVVNQGTEVLYVGTLDINGILKEPLRIDLSNHGAERTK